MIEELQRTLIPCLKGHCGFVEITRHENDYATSVMWCRFCGKLEVYEEQNYAAAVRTVNLKPKVFEIVEQELSKER